MELLAKGVGLDRDRAFYPTVTIVIASNYALFAVMGLPRRHALSSRWPAFLSDF